MTPVDRGSDPTLVIYRDGATFGQVVRRVRRGRGMTMDDVAAACGLPKSALSTIENGKTDPRLSTVVKLAGALRLPLHSLLGHACAFPGGERDA